MQVIPPAADEGNNTSPREVLNALDAADEMRQSRGTPGKRAAKLLQKLTARGSLRTSKLAALDHLRVQCAHESSADIGTLPSYPTQRTPLNGALNVDIREAADAAWDAIIKANEPEQFFNHGGSAVWVKVGAESAAVIESVTVPRMAHLRGIDSRI